MVAAAVLTLQAPSVTADDAAGEPAAAADSTAARTKGARRVWWLAPPPGFYPYYTADPRRAQSALVYLNMLTTEIPQADGPRSAIRLGGRFGLFRIHPAGEPDLGWQLDIEAGFFGFFDLSRNLDNIGWDGVYGLLVSWKPRADLGFRFGTLHDSAHVGDEYAEDTGRQRIGYTRNEWIAGVSWSLSDSWRLYGELGYDRSPKEFQEPLRAQAGVEYFSRRRLWGDRLRWYAAADFTAFEESDWRITGTAQLGVALPTGRGSSRWRAAIELFDGRSVLGEFFLRDERYVALGLFFDL
jgi:hypothetical protein